MRIVHHFTQIQPGAGVPQAVLDLTMLLAEAGHDVTLLTAVDSDLSTCEGVGRQDGLRVVTLDRSSRLFERLSRAGLRRATEALDGADVLHLHGIWRPRNLRLSALARALGVPQVLSPHGGLGDWGMAQGRVALKTLYYRLFARRSLAAARIIHFTAEAERQAARAWLPHDRVSVVPLAMDLAPYSEPPGKEHFARRRPDVSPDLPAVLLLGRIHPHKRPELLIEALATLQRSGTGCQLLLAGEGEPAYTASLGRLAETQGVGDSTHFLGFVGGRDKLSLCQRADLMALPSIHENFGLALFESLACGTPVLTTRAAATWPEIEASGGGRIVEPTSEAFANQIAELLADEGLRRSMGAAGRAWVLEWLDPGAVATRYEAMYQAAADPAP